MSDTTLEHPSVVLDALLAKGGRAHRRTRLKATHEICRRHQASGSRDFSFPTIGRLLEAEGILKGRALYKTQSVDYRELISAWAAYVGPAILQSSKLLASHEYLTRIHDPAIRSVMQAVIAERDKLKAEVNLLKANMQVVVDRRPVGAGNPGPVIVLPTRGGLNTQLTPSEREALEKVVSADYLKRQGLREGTHGEILNEHGRTVFDVGFARAIRKILGT
ncbi:MULTISPECIES: gamma-mobile-trio protein GmtX [unclassified Caballeronia]|uniref:gamma-mobile-trio protein GmtX n=1 Tax=unclassified Caballeronia TaxID=2646786 RepID=UPI0028650661|nr:MULTISPECIES: gamma-mobile-trio protein GmtX [unclassified Caballeronia]MDR5777143.1 gamma-mobile-trio protein GmtX [Caballeronia sp. LZ002]MDR5798701.1 gamma-mobile-trio protein GmtX [Caballeronia sp. LZ001]MDR5852524.1 gamma-mobile-trio protein GmtX [Caballeronia sp. LZ003]